MANQLNEFDKLVKETLENYEAPYDHDHWEELEEELNVTVPGMSSYFGAVTTGLALVGVVFIGMLYLNLVYFTGSSSEQLTENEMGTAVSQTEQNEDIQPENLIEEKSLENTEEPTPATNKETIADPNPDSANNNKSGNGNTAKEDYSLKSDNNQSASSILEAISDVPEEIAVSEEDNAPKMRTGCTGMTIDFNASEEYGKDAHFLWNFGDGYFSNEANPSHTFNKEGTFDVSLSVTTPASGQITSNVVQAMIEVVEAPIANLEFAINSPEIVEISNKSYNAAEIQWKLDDEIMSAKSEISVSLADNTHHKLALIAYNDGGCSDTLYADVNSINAGSEFPKAYETSYGTSFAPGAIIDDGTVTSLKIFNKATNELVFEGSGSKGWEGNELDGTEASEGKYQWVMLVSKDDALDIYRGEIQLR